ncbi:MAG: response regulator [Prevotella sp.]|nr:response regulator [Prevotella sp.]
MKPGYKNIRIVVAVVFVLLLLVACGKVKAPKSGDANYREIDSIVHSYDHPDSLNQLLKAYQKTHNKLGEAITLRFLGKKYRDQSKFEQAIDLHQKGVSISTELRDTTELIQGLNNLATDYRRLGMLDLASETHYRALNLCMAQKDKTSDLALKNYTVSLNGLGNVYLQLGNLVQADSVFREALKTETKLGSDLGQAINLANLAAIYEDRGEIDSAWVYYKRSFEKNKMANAALGMSLCRCHFGRLYEKQHLTTKAIDEYQKAYDVLEKEGDLWHWLEPCLALTEIFLKTHQTDKAKLYLEKANQAAMEIRSKEHMAKIHYYYYQIYEGEGNMAKAFEHFKKSDVYNDSIVNVQVMNQLQNLRIKIEHQRTRTDLEEARNDAQQQRKMKRNAYLMLGVMLLFTLAFIGGTWYIIRARERERKLMRRMQDVRENFFTNITHEFRTPLTVISGLSEQLQGEKAVDAAKVRESAVVVNRQSKKLLKLINQLLDISKVKSVVGEADWQHGNIVAFIRMVTENYRQYAQNKQIELIYTPEKNIVEMDFVPDYMEKLITNLIGNSFRHTPKMGHIKLKTMVVEENLLKFVVSDDGEGIAPDVIDHIFEPFFQGNDDAHNIGTGIGLSLVKQIVEAMNGTVGAESELGKGTTVTVHIPLQHGKENLEMFNIDKYLKLNKKPVEVEDDQIADSDQNENSGCRVLVIEDNNDVAYYIGELLEDDHCSVFYAKDGEEGLAKARDLVPDIILTDLMMPGTDGLEVCRQIRASQLLSHIPIIVITAKASDSDRVELLEAGADAYLVKPFNTDELHVRMKKLIEQRNTLREKFSQDMDNGVGPAAADHLNPSERDYLRRVKETVYKLMAQGQVDAETLASYMFVSRAQLNRKLQAITGKTTTSFIVQIRMDYAKRLLESDISIPVGEVATKCGYEDVGHFSRTFKQVVGQTPSQYRKMQ